jgi:hypothetical protein
MASVHSSDPDCHGCFGDRHSWICFSILLLLVGLPNRVAIATTTSRRAIMTLHNNRQISRRPKNTSAGQLVFSHCQTAFPITWRRYWSAPWGNYRCPECRQLSYARANFWWVSTIIFVAMALVGIIGALIGAYVFNNAWMGLLLIFVGYLAIGFPLDKWLDGHLRHLKIRY